MLPVSGFSKMTRQGKISYLEEVYFQDASDLKVFLDSYLHNDPLIQEIFDDFSENTITNFHTPYGIVPNMLINNKLYCIPMAIEESSVVAACSKSAKFWMSRGGFSTQVISNKKIGHVHFEWEGDPEKLTKLFDDQSQSFITGVEALTHNMKKRGGGVSSIELINKTSEMKNLYQLKGTFVTCDAMGANLINSVLEEWATILTHLMVSADHLPCESRKVNIIMAILSNYTPECLVKASVSCKIQRASDGPGALFGISFANKFIKAVKIAQIDPYRATTHNKGIFNGIDAVVMATGNDTRSVEACGHAYAARTGRYRSLSHAYIKNDEFIFELEIPMNIGTVGGLTSLHPLAKKSLELLGNPNAEELMEIIASVGLAQNFAAIQSLVTTGIQKGHMKMHLMNIMNSLRASEDEKELIKEEFEEKTISYNAVNDFLTSMRKIQ